MAYCRDTPFPDPYDDDKPEWRKRAETIEYGLVTILVVSAFAYGILLGVMSLG